MALVRRQQTRPEGWDWVPFGRLSSLRDELASILEDPGFAGSAAPQLFQGWAPALDLYEDNDKLTVKLEVPGMKKEEIDISLEGDVLSISGERKSKGSAGESDAYLQERYFGKFYRSVQLPASVNEEKVEASYEDGVLTITLPKADEAKRKRIDVK